MSTPIDGLNHAISLEKAVQMTTLYREQKDNILKEEYLGKNILPLSESFNRTTIDQILAQKDCIGMRVYYSMSTDLRIHAIIVGINSEYKDIVPPTITDTIPFTISGIDTGDTAIGIIAEEAASCPPICRDSPPLNP